MRTNIQASAQVRAPNFTELFTPKFITVLSEGYSLRHLQADALAGLTVAIVALPLSMAIAIASGASPTQGLYTAIIGGFFVSALGGSRFQIGGPAGAFIVLVAATAQIHGMDGLILATILSGLILMIAGFFRLGTYIKFIPYPVTVGFTSGIAIIIFASQVRALLGLTLDGAEPGPLVSKVPAIWQALPTANPSAVTVAFSTIIIIVGLKRLKPHWPGMLLAVAATSVLAGVLQLPVETIGTQFGGITSSLPLPSAPEVSLSKLQAILPNAVAFALLGSIESLLSAVVADGMTGRRHRSNCELVAQGVANIASGIFGGICVTGTIARTATNVRSGAHGPIAGILHSVFLLLFILIAAPLASYIPLACLAGILVVVAWNMIEKRAISVLLRVSRGDATVLMATFSLTIFRDLTEAIVVGFALGSVLFIHRMSTSASVETEVPFVPEDKADSVDNDRGKYDEYKENDPDVVIYRITGAFFFGAAASVGSVLESIGDTCSALIVDFSAVPFLDSTAANTVDGVFRTAKQNNVAVYLTGMSDEIRDELVAHGVKPPLVYFADTVTDAKHLISASQTP
jgi:SulP family sulfate permease